jgi:Tfp pilus assembly pilus retraction ATPase PilT
MITLNQSLIQLISKGTITVEAALECTQDSDELIKSISEMQRKAS